MELLYNTKDIQARQSSGDFYYSHIYNGHYEGLDHILVSKHFAFPDMSLRETSAT
jgi:predicted extracellular nuclease